MTVTAVLGIVGGIVSLFGAVVSVAFGMVAIRSQAHREASSLYQQMVKLRLENPEILKLSRQWTPANWQRVYEQSRPDDRPWVVYYSYVELCLDYCSTVLSARHRLSRGAYKDHHKRLVKLLLTEHNPIIEDLLEEDKYISNHIMWFRKKLERDGWSWRDEHAALLLPVSRGA